jgi:heme-degrading monooxygenase HmoA
MTRPPGEHVVLWAYKVRPGRSTEFEHMYGPNGEWARLFREWDGYLGTDLWRDIQDPRRYVTVDRWRSRADYERFRAAARASYLELDARGARLTESEARLATLEPVPRDSEPPISDPEVVSSPRRSGLSPRGMRRGWRSDTLAGENS